MIKVGEINEFIVLRKSDLGYMLGHKDEQVLLHFKQANRELADNEIVHAFVFFDSKSRLSASLEEPFITLDKANWVTVCDVKDNLGVFVNNNCFKDVLISKDNLPNEPISWPQVGDKVFAKLKLKKNSLTAKPLNKLDILEIYPNLEEHQTGEIVDATIVRVSDKALHALTKTNCYVFIPIKQTRGTYRLGEEVSMTIIGRHDSEYVGSLNKVKEELVDADTITILNYLSSNNGVLPLTAKSQSEEIETYFKMSRKAFKRAIGSLYKEKRIYFDEVNTYLVKED